MTSRSMGRAALLPGWAAMAGWIVLLVAVVAATSAAVGLPTVVTVALTAVLAQPGDLLRRYVDDRYEEQRELRRLIRAGFYQQGGRLPKVGELTGVVVGIHPTQWPDLRAAHREATVPQYVRRDLHAHLVGLIRGGGRILVDGPAAAGKTRLAFEAALEAVPDHRMLLPTDASGEKLGDLLAAGGSVRRAVIWLDDLERYLKAGTVNRNLLTMLCPGDSSDVAVVATLRAAERRELQESPREDTVSSPIRTVDDVLDLFTLVTVDSALSAAERVRARQSSDPRITGALRSAPGGRVPEYLAAAPSLLRHWRQDSGDPTVRVGTALVSAAVDCQRTGTAGPVPESVLADLLPLYLGTGERVEPHLLAAAFTWACTAPPGAPTACLDRIGHDRYLARDILVDHARANAPDSIPRQVWDRMLALSDGNASAAMSISRAARAYGERQVSQEALSQAARSDPAAMNNLGVDHFERGQFDAARHWYELAADQDNVDAVYNLGVLAERQGLPALAEKHYRRAASKGHAAAANSLGVLVHRRGDDDAARAWFLRAIELGHAGAQENLRLLPDGP